MKYRLYGKDGISDIDR